MWEDIESSLNPVIESTYPLNYCFPLNLSMTAL